MLTLERLAWLKHGAPPRNILEAAIKANVAGGMGWYTAGPGNMLTFKAAVSPVQALTVDVLSFSGETGANIYLEAEYDPAASPAITEDWSGTAGTVYGAKIDVLTGKLIVDSAMVTLDSTIPSGTSGIRNITAIGDAVRFEYYPYRSIGVGENAPVYSDRFENAETNAGVPWVVNIGPGTAPRMYVCLSSEYNTDAKIRAWFNDNPSKFVYKIPSPVEYTLTAEALDTLEGQNVLWCDAGQTTVTYYGKKWKGA